MKKKNSNATEIEMNAFIDIFCTETDRHLARYIENVDIFRLNAIDIDAADCADGRRFHLDHASVVKLCVLLEKYPPSIPCEGMIVFTNVTPDFLNSHTCRELSMMLYSGKPMAAFVLEEGIDEENIFPSTKFQKYVKEGKILKYEFAYQIHGFNLRRILFASPGEEWRVNAYIAMWEAAGKVGWNDGFRLLEEMLLGYHQENPSHKAIMRESGT